MPLTPRPRPNPLCTWCGIEGGLLTPWSFHPCLCSQVQRGVSRQARIRKTHTHAACSAAKTHWVPPGRAAQVLNMEGRALQTEKGVCIVSRRSGMFHTSALVLSFRHKTPQNTATFHRSNSSSLKCVPALCQAARVSPTFAPQTGVNQATQRAQRTCPRPVFVCS